MCHGNSQSKVSFIYRLPHKCSLQNLLLSKYTSLTGIPFRLFPLSVRSIGSGIATATNWGSNFLIGLTFLPMMEGLTSVGTFALYTAICIACWITVWRVYPETCGMSLEEVSGLLKDGWGVQESVRRAEERKHAAS